MLTYLRCVWWNKFTLIGYGVFTIWVILSFTSPNWISMVLLQVAAILLGATHFGLPTYRTYKRACNLYSQGKARELSKISTTFYCNRIGLEAARREWEIT